jgi:hypothetical protein
MPIKALDEEANTARLERSCQGSRGPATIAQQQPESAGESRKLPVRDLAQVIQAVHRGIYQLDPAVMRRVMTSLTGVKRAEC